MSDWKRRIIRACYRSFIRRPYNRIGASVARIAYGTWLLFFYFQSLPIRHFVWGEAGPNPHEDFLRYVSLAGEFSLLTYSASPWWLDALLVLAILSSITFLIGLYTKASLVVAVTLLWSFHARNPYILDGGDNLGRIVLIFFILLKSSDHFAVDRWRRRRRQRSTPASNLLHNFALYAITVQYCLLYLTAGLSKVAGPLWQNGTAIYYVLKCKTFSNPILGPPLSRDYLWITIATYLTVATQCSFPYLVWSRRWRVPIILAMILLHVGIAVLMGLVHFSLGVIAGLLLLIPNESYCRILSLVPPRCQRQRACS
jgi:hypothetical protein